MTVHIGKPCGVDREFRWIAGQDRHPVTFDENAGKTLLVVHDRYPSKEALDSGSTGAMPEGATNSTSFSPAWIKY